MDLSNSQKRTAFSNHGFEEDPDDDDTIAKSISDTSEPIVEHNHEDGIKLVNGHAPKMENNFDSSRKSVKSTKEPWDVFEIQNKDTISKSDYQFWRVISKGTRIFFVTAFAVIVCLTAVISKLIFVYMLSMINVPRHDREQSLKTFNGSVIYSVRKTEVTWIWAILLCIIAPNIFTLVKSFNKIIFKTTNPLKCSVLLAALVVETIHSVGLCILVFIVLPNVDPIVGMIAMLNVGTIPGLLKIRYPSRNKLDDHEGKKDDANIGKMFASVVMNVIIVLLHIGSLGLTCYYILKPPFSTNDNEKQQRQEIIIYLAVASVCISVSWWENFVPKGTRDSTGLPALKRSFMRSRSKILFISMSWKIILTTCILPVVYGTLACGKECVDMIYFKHPGDVYAVNGTIINTIFTDGGSGLLTQCDTLKKWLPFIIALIYMFLNGACFKIGKAACKVVAQTIAFALPLAISLPVTIVILIAFMSTSNVNDVNPTQFKFGEKCVLRYPYWVDNDHNPILKMTEKGNFQSYWPLIVGGVLSYFSLLLMANYIWSPKKERLSSTDKLFVKPLYCGVLLEQSMMLNRRRTDEEYKTTAEASKKSKVPIPDWPDDPNFNPTDNMSDWSYLRTIRTPMIYMCATMWHETQNEMTQVLKSICRMDEDQCTRKNLMQFFNIHDPDYYEMEAHIFFDDAFMPHGEGDYEYTVNSYVKTLLDCVSVAATAVHNKAILIKDPVMIPTPYGGQLIWKLPGGNKLIAHLKDKQKIRHKKRWSQVMYMYYFLGHKLLTLKKSRRSKQIIAENTFILALDGDVDFQPSAVQLLVDRMKKNLTVGAACGRIHPIGGGPMIWYQKFEYAVSHWLQKAAENMIGCVLCSPGCFSLFRGSSLMDDNVMRRYTEIPQEAYQYVQYDQGEDRWLCTLLLQQGYKVEYVAASDALTFAPEGFYEFYNQRRRWSPSTMANIIDLLLDWKNVTSKNDDISMLCVGYQMLLLASSLLTPGTILLMLLGALYTAFPAIAPHTAFAVNIAPVVVMVLLCFVAKKEVQLSYAAILSTVYALIMMIVIVGLLKEAVEAQWCSVTTFFLLFVSLSFVIAALLHPQEFWCIIHGMLYFLAIPSMSMLMMLYALGNLHDISWGTRDTGTVAGTPQSSGPPQKRSRMDDIRNWVMGPTSAVPNQTSDYQFSFGNLFRCMCCPQGSTQNEDARLRAILERLDDMENRLTTMSRPSMLSNEPEDRQTGPAGGADQTPFSHQSTLFEGAGEQRLNPMFTPEKQAERDDLKNPYWIEDLDEKKKSKKRKVDFLANTEIVFWQKFIEKYLKPLDFDRDHKKRVEKSLLELRNKVCLAFLLMNALFVTIVYTLTEVNKQEQGSLSIRLPCKGGKIKDDEGYGQGHIEPISFAFTAVFGIMLLVQFICMLFHRYSTLLHVISSPTAELNLKKNLQKRLREKFFKDYDDDDSGEQEITVDEGLKLVRDLQNNKHDTDSDTSSVYSLDMSDVDSEYGDDLIETKKPSDMMRKFKKRENEVQRDALSKNFVKNFSKLKQVVDYEETASMSPVRPEDEFDKNPDEQREHFVRQAFGPSRLTHKSIRTVVTLMQNESIKDQIRRKTEHLVKIKKLQREKAKANFQGIVKKHFGQKNFANLVAQAKHKDKVEKIEGEIEKLKPETEPSPSSPTTAEPENRLNHLPPVTEKAENALDNSDIEDSEDDDIIEDHNLSDDSDISDDYVSSGKPRGGSFHVSSMKRGSANFHDADVLF